ncbi:MAG: hypothetical protein NZ580_02795 [Bacteroidia bacterium]|nr:hypothetical protein [Bacteroidia bacterium]MDW8235713.1 hypothetical protein [Bacteroidia bacterium]
MWRLAWRYVWHSPRPGLRWLMGLSFTGLVLSAWAWEVVNAVFNGFSGFLEEVFQRVDPHVQLVGGNLNDSLKQRIASLSEVQAVSGVYEKIAVLKYSERQAVVKLRIVDENYPAVSRIGQQLVWGRSFPLSKAGAILGSGVAVKLALMDREEHPLWIYVVSSGKGLALSGVENLPRRRIHPQGIFSVQKEYDDTWAIMNGSDWPEFRGNYDVIEIRLNEGVVAHEFVRKLKMTLPPGTQARLSRQQHDSFYRVLAQEQMLARVGLGLLLLLTLGGMLSALSTLLILNRRDWALYQALGASVSQVERLLSYIHLILVGLGGVIGIFLGSLSVWVQARYHLLELRGGEGFLLQHFPVKWEAKDTVMLLGLLMGAIILLHLYSQHYLRHLSFRAALQGD